MSLDQSKVIATMRRNDREELRVGLSAFKGKTRCDVRVWFDAGGEYRPGKQGISIAPEHLAGVLNALKAACDALGIQP